MHPTAARCGHKATTSPGPQRGVKVSTQGFASIPSSVRPGRYAPTRPCNSLEQTSTCNIPGAPAKPRGKHHRATHTPSRCARIHEVGGKPLCSLLQPTALLLLPLPPATLASTPVQLLRRASQTQRRARDARAPRTRRTSRRPHAAAAACRPCPAADPRRAPKHPVHPTNSAATAKQGAAAAPHPSALSCALC